MIENVRGLLGRNFDSYRSAILRKLSELGYRVHIQLLNASDFGVPQLRPRVFIVAIRRDQHGIFSFPLPKNSSSPTVGETLVDLMSANGWEKAKTWKQYANGIAPTVVGGSKKHGGPDLGPSRAKKQWAELGVDGLGIADEAPKPDFDGNPRLTPQMLARIQGFPDDWSFGDKKTRACRMIGNALPPPVAQAVGLQIHQLLLDNEINTGRSKKKVSQRAVV